MDRKPELLSIHGQRTKPSPPTSLLAGLIQWCVLGPLVPRELESHIHSKTRKDEKSDSGGRPSPLTQQQKGMEIEFDGLVAKLHAELLSVVLSHSKSFRPRSLTGDSVAVIVAALLGFDQQLRSGEGGAGGSRMNEAVERLAQFLQISLSTGILALNPGQYVLKLLQVLP